MSRPDSARPEARRRDTYHHGDLRRALVDATLRLVEENGPQGFTLRGAARAAGVTPAASYHHFDDKEALLAAVAEEGFELFRVALETSVRRPASSRQERARNVGVGYVLFAVEHPTRFRIMVGYGVQNRLHKGGLGAVALGTYQLVHSVLVEGLKERSDEPVSDAEVLGWWSVVHGLAFLAIDGHLGDLGKSSKRVENVVRRVISALDVRGH